MDEKKREKLERILKREKEKELLSNKVPDARRKEPAKFRSTVLDIDQQPAPTGALGNGLPGTRQSTASSTARYQMQKRQEQQRLEALRAEQAAVEHAAQAAASRRRAEAPKSERLKLMQAKRASPWTKLSTFEAEMFSRDQNAMKEALKEQIAGQRKFLDAQMREQEAAADLERAEKAAVAAQIANDVEKYKADELELKATAALKNVQLKVDRDTQIRLEREKREKKALKQRLEEKREVEEIQRSLDAERRRTLAKKAGERKAAMQLMAENEERLAARRMQDKEKELHDFQMMEQYRAMLEREERVREERLMAMYAKARQRAQVIGEDVLAQSEATKTKLDLLERQAYDDKCAEDDRADQAKRDALAAQVKDTLATLKEQQRLKDEEEEAEKQELRNYYKTVRDRDAREAQAEDDKILRARQCAIANKKVLFEQIEEAEERRIEEEVSMTSTERQFNTNLLSSATYILG